ncbi:hypothetical protein K3T49_08465 [Paenibacillus sonchi]|nr:hypothetical protein [Paenibacillus sonchi]
MGASGPAEEETTAKVPLLSASLSSIRSWQIAEGDMQLISGPLDKLGINYHNGTDARHDSEDGLMQISTVNVGDGHTDIGWPIYPQGFYIVLSRIHELMEIFRFLLRRMVHPIMTSR